DVAALDALLATWSVAPPLTDRARRPAEKVATKAVRRQVERVLAATHHLDDPDHVDEAHEVRKAARRLRHAADAVSRPPASTLAGWAPTVGGLGQRIQGMLGDHRDALLLADHVREHAADVADPAPYLQLVAHAEREARQAIGGLVQAVLELRDARHP
ncbi:CHAD domain-containing protein, partial [Nocardioides sp.]